MPIPGGGPIILSQLNGGAPAAHAASHSDGATDEILVEALATAEPSTTKSLMSDGAGALVFGAPVAAAHALGGAQHTADTLSNFNAKISDAVLVDTDGIVLVTGVNSLTGNWDAGPFKLLAESVQARPGTTFLFRREDGVESFRLQSSGVINFALGILFQADPLPATDNARSLGADGTGFAKVVTNIIRPSSTGSASLLIKDASDTTVMTLVDGGNLNLSPTSTVRFNSTGFVPDDIQWQYGSGGDWIWQYETVNQTNNTLILGTQGAEGNTFVFTDKARITLDHVVGTPATPTMRWHDGSAVAGNWGSVTHDGTDLVFTSNAGAIILDPASNVILPGGATATVSFGSDSAVLLEVRTRFVQSETGEALLFRDALGASAFQVSALGGVLFSQDIGVNADNARTIGVDTAGFSKIVVNTIRPSTTGSASLFILRGNGATWLTLFNAGNASFGLNTGMDDNFNFFWGTSTDAQMRWDTSQTNDALRLDLNGSNTFIIGTSSTPDLAIAAQSTPTMVFHDGGVVAGDWGSITHDGTNLSVVVNAGDLEVTGNIIPEADGTRTVGISTAVYNTVWVRTVRPDVGQVLDILDQGGTSAIEIGTGTGVVFNQPGNNRDFTVESADDTVALTVDGELNFVGVGVALNAHLAKFHVNQNDAAGAIPVLALEQLDIDDTFINYIGTSAADGTRSISSDTTEDGAKVGAIRTELNGVLGWIRVYADES